ncbi:MAG: hypothetical protein NTV86_19530, partial [Planctomycetota bacterium]|nr:hypothetical protein [Planctomycetota bacterium]
MGKRTGRAWNRAVATAAWVLVGMGVMQNGCGTESAQVSPGAPTSRDAQSSGRETLAQLDSQRQEALEKEKNPSIRLFTDPKTAGKGLLVTCTKNVSATGPQAGVVDIAVTNLLEEEVFLEVTGMDIV